MESTQLKEKTPEANLLKNLLIVDSDPLWRDWVKTTFIFSELDVNVLEAENFEHAMLYLEKFEVSVLLADSQLPNGMGIELLKNAREFSPKTRIVLFLNGGMSSPPNRSAAISLGAAYALSKQEAVSTIDDLVRDLLEEEE